MAEEFVSKSEDGVGGESGAGTWERGASLQSLCCCPNYGKRKKKRLRIYHEMYLIRLLPYCTYSRAVGLLWALSYLLPNFLLSHIAADAVVET